MALDILLLCDDCHEKAFSYSVHMSHSIKDTIDYEI